MAHGDAYTSTLVGVAGAEVVVAVLCAVVAGVVGFFLQRHARRPRVASCPLRHSLRPCIALVLPSSAFAAPMAVHPRPWPRPRRKSLQNLPPPMAQCRLADTPSAAPLCSSLVPARRHWSACRPLGVGVPTPRCALLRSSLMLLACAGSPTLVGVPTPRCRRADPEVRRRLLLAPRALVAVGESVVDQ